MPAPYETNKNIEWKWRQYVVESLNEVAAGGTQPQAFDPANTNAGMTLSGSDYSAARNSSGAPSYRIARGLNGHASGKYQARFWVLGVINFAEFGIVAAAHALNTYIGATANGWGLFNDGSLANNAVFTPTSNTFAGSMMLDVWVDIDAGKLWFGIDNKPFGVTGDPVSGTGALFTGVTGTLYTAVSSNVVGPTFTAQPPPLWPGYSAW
jgi:hypothetical protein